MAIKNQKADLRPNQPAPITPRQLYNHLLLTEAQRDALEVVLVSPRNPLNIGAAARAMANFGFRRLSIVAPYAPMWREARSAIGAAEVLQNAKSTECLAEAVAGCTLVIGTGTLTYRKPEQPVVALPHLPRLVAQEFVRGGRAALVFGSEKHGLTREDLSLCHILVEIPTDPGQPSMNLGQAVAVCLYELSVRLCAETQEPPPRAAAAPASQLERLAEVVEQAMQAAGSSAGKLQPANRHDLRLLLRRLAPTVRDTRRILGIFRHILWRLNHDPARSRDLR
jgi:tRNA/rRNA methyltransferase